MSGLVAFLKTYTHKDNGETNMLERMDKASDFRRAAWDSLGKGGWAPSVLGFVFCVFAIIVVTFFANTAMVALMKAWNLLNVEAEELSARRIEEVLMHVGKYAFAMLLAIVPRLYIESAANYGFSAMALAVMRQGARFGHAVSGFGHGWKSAWLRVLAGMYIFFWSLLLIIPGIRAFYSYRLMMFLMVERPELPSDKILNESKRLMDGRRWKLFCLDFSFIGWYLLGIFSFGLGFLFIVPYHYAACAAFYEDLLNRDEAGAFGAEYGADD